MDNRSIRERIDNVIIELSGTDKPLEDHTDVVDDLHLDSLDCVELIMSLEEEFGIEIPDDDWHSGHHTGTVTLRTPVGIAEYIDRRLAEKERNARAYSQ